MTQSGIFAQFVTTLKSPTLGKGTAAASNDQTSPALAEKAKLPPQRLVASGYGEFHPIASNKTPVGRAKNRRIEILLTPMLAPRTMSKAKLKAAVEDKTEVKPKPSKNKQAANKSR